MYFLTYSHCCQVHFAQNFSGGFFLCSNDRFWCVDYTIFFHAGMGFAQCKVCPTCQGNKWKSSVFFWGVAPPHWQSSCYKCADIGPRLQWSERWKIIIGKFQQY